LTEIGSKTAEKNSAQTSKQTNQQTLRKQWSLGREPKNEHSTILEAGYKRSEGFQ